MKTAIVTESFFPQVNGVTNSVRHTVDRLRARGHDVLVIAPGPGETTYRDVPVVRSRSVSLPRYGTFPLGLPDAAVESALGRFAPDVVHLASPIALGAVGMRAARRLGVPTVAVFQTDIGKFARTYGLNAEAAIASWSARLHRKADRTLVPSATYETLLRSWGVRDVHRWGRGVSLDLFSPTRRNPDLRAAWTRGRPDAVVVGFVGRLAQEKQVRRLTELSRIPGVEIVVIGDGPERAWLTRNLPQATFTGMLGNEELATAFASLDVFVHMGTAETFCQTVQEAQASGVAVVAPSVGGPLDLVQHGHTGLLHDPDRPASLRAAVERLASYPSLRAHLRHHALLAVSSRSWPSVVDELIDVHYPAVLGASRAA